MKLKQSLIVAGVAALMCVAASTAMAQGGGGAGGGGGGGGGRRNGGGGGFGGGNFDPAQAQQMQMDRIHEQMGVTDEAEWKAIQDRLTKVMDAQRATFAYNTRGGGRGRGGAGAGGGGGGGRGGAFGQPSPELEALRTAIENNAPPEQIKAALEKFRAARKAKQEAFAKAQAELQKILTPKQEAVAVTNGLLE